MNPDPSTASNMRRRSLTGAALQVFRDLECSNGSSSLSGIMVETVPRRMQCIPDPNGFVDDEGLLWLPISAYRWAIRHVPNRTFPDVIPLRVAYVPALQAAGIRPSTKLYLRALSGSRLGVTAGGRWFRSRANTFANGDFAYQHVGDAFPIAFAAADEPVQKVIRTIGAQINLGMRAQTLQND